MDAKVSYMNINPEYDFQGIERHPCIVYFQEVV